MERPTLGLRATTDCHFQARLLKLSSRAIAPTPTQVPVLARLIWGIALRPRQNSAARHHDRGVIRTGTAVAVASCMARVPASTQKRRNQVGPTTLGLALLAVASSLGCGGGVLGSAPSQPPPHRTVSVSVSAASSTVLLGATDAITATVTGSTNTTVTWSVGNVSGGNATVGTISAAGNYTAPGVLPQPATETITATSAADTTESASATLTIASNFTVAISGPATVAAGSTATYQATLTPAPGRIQTQRSIGASRAPAAPGQPAA